MQYPTRARGCIATDAVGGDSILGIVTEHLLHELAEALAGGLLLLEILLLDLALSLLKIEAFLCGGLERLAIILLELLDSILVDGVGHEASMVGDLRNKHKNRKCISTTGR